MSGLFNPYALTALGKPLQQRQSPELRVEAPHISRAQLDMAQHTFVRFLDHARLSRVPNPTQQGRLADGTPYRIVTASGAPIMQVWPVEVSQKDLENKLKHGIVVLAGKKFVVTYFNTSAGRWVSNEVKNGVCGITLYPATTIKDAKDGGFALGSYGGPDGDYPTKFSDSGGWSDYRNAGIGDTYIFGEWIEYVNPAVCLFISNELAIIAVANLRNSKLSIYKVSDIKDSDAAPDVELLEVMDVNNDFGYMHRPTLKASKKNQILFIGSSLEYIYDGPNDAVLPSSIFELVRHRIRAYLDATPLTTWKSVIDVHPLDNGDFDVSKSVEITKITEHYLTFKVDIEAESRQEYKMGRVVNNRVTATLPQLDNKYHPNGKLYIDYSAVSGKTFSLIGPTGAMFYSEYDDYAVGEATCKKESIPLYSYYDFNGDIKDAVLDVDVKLTASSKSKSEAEDLYSGLDPWNVDHTTWVRVPQPEIRSGLGWESYTTEDDYVPPDSDIGTPKGASREYTVTAKYKVGLRVGGGNVQLMGGNGIDISFKYNNGVSVSMGDMPTKAILNVDVSIISIIAVNELSGVVAGVMYETFCKDLTIVITPEEQKETGKYILIGRLSQKISTVIYHHGVLTYKKLLLDEPRVIKFEVFRDFENGSRVTNDNTTTSSRIALDVPRISIKDTKTTEGEFPVFTYTSSSESDSHYLNSRHSITEGKYDPKIGSPIRPNRIGMGVKLPNELSNHGESTPTYNVNHYTSTDPISGGCAVTGKWCNVLVSPNGVVTEMKDLIPMYNPSVNMICAST